MYINNRDCVQLALPGSKLVMETKLEELEEQMEESDSEPDQEQQPGSEQKSKESEAEKRTAVTSKKRGRPQKEVTNQFNKR